MTKCFHEVNLHFLQLPRRTLHKDLAGKHRDWVNSWSFLQHVQSSTFPPSHRVTPNHDLANCSPHGVPLLAVYYKYSTESGDRIDGHGRAFMSPVYTHSLFLTSQVNEEIVTKHTPNSHHTLSQIIDEWGAVN